VAQSATLQNEGKFGLESGCPGLNVLSRPGKPGRKLLRKQSWEDLARAARFQPAAMASLCSVSLRQLERHFKNHFRKTPRQWARGLRWRLAQKLIAQGRSNKWVVAELGFTDNAHLCREFKKLCGATPQSHAPYYEGGTRARL
jgi:transcriptional regulator GlxA family with amidase domain